MAPSGKANWLVALLVLAIYLYIFGAGVQREMLRQTALQQNTQRKGVASRWRR